MNKNSSRGFTLIELLVVIAIIGVLASTIIGCPNDTNWFRVLVSHGPNGSASNDYDADNIVLTLCQCVGDCK